MESKRRKKRGTAVVLAPGPKACLLALRCLASLGVASGDTYSILHTPSLWPHRTHEDVKDAWIMLAEGGFEVAAHVVAATLITLKGLALVPGFRVRLPVGTENEAPVVRGSGRNPAFLRLRDFVDSLVMTAEATLARDAAGSPLAKGRVRLPEQHQLRQFLGLPKGASAARARLHPTELSDLLQSASGVRLEGQRLAQLVALVGGPYPDTSALVRSGKQPVPFLEAERLLLSVLSEPALQKILRSAPPATARPAGQPSNSKPPLPAWHDEFMRAARLSDTSRATGSSPGPSQAHARAAEPGGQPIALSQHELERWWLGPAADG